MNYNNQEQRHYLTILNMLGIAYWEWSAENGFYASEKYYTYALSDEPFDKVKNNSALGDIIHCDDIPTLKNFFAQGDMHQEKASTIVRLKMKDKTYRWTEIFGFKEYSPNGDTLRMSCVMRDVDQERREQAHKLQLALERTQQALNEKTLLQSEQELLYTALFNLVPMVISCNITQNCYNMMNYNNFTTKIAKISGTYDDLIAIGLTTIPDSHKKKFEDAFSRENMIKAYENGKKSVRLEHQQIGDDGIIRWIRTQAIFVKSSIDGDLHQITLAQDISEQKEKEIQLHNALIEAKRADEAKNEFLSRMSHDLRTPMNAIIGLSALTLDDAKKPQVVRENMTKMRSASDFMLGLINDILDMAKIESGAVKFFMEPYSYKEFIVNMKTMFQAQCDEKGLSFIMPEPTHNPVARTDKVRINQIFFNILSNAVKYTPQGGTITYTVKNLVFEGTKASGDCEISDNGIGMSEEFQKHLFKPFIQESDRVTPELQGSGLGLSITKQLVELMGGSIKIKSKQGEGTTVIVHMTFELIEVEAPIKPVNTINPEAISSILAHKNILLVEDHPLNTQIAKALLEKQNLCVTHAPNGKRAVEIFDASPIGNFDAILMDIRMPIMSGLEATKKIRSLSRADASTVPIIAMTANAYEEDIKKSRKAGMNAHLSKPIDPKKLYETLAQLFVV